MAVFRLVPFSSSNMDLVLRWRNAPRVKDNMLDDSTISAEDHLNFLEALAVDGSRAYFVVYMDELPVAALYVSRLGQPEVTWGCYIGIEKMIPGLFVALFLMATDIAFAESKTVALYSEVAEHNSAPVRFNRFLGLGVPTPQVRITVSGQSVNFLGYRLERSRLADVRARALKVMPGSIKRAYNDWKVED